MRRRKLRINLSHHAILMLLILAMAGGYAFSYSLAPLQQLLDSEYGWNADTYGRYCSAASFLNVFLLILIFGGMAVDKLGISKSAIFASLTMLAGAFINYFALLPEVAESHFIAIITQPLNLSDTWWNITPFSSTTPPSAKLAAIGLMLFGSGMEICGIAVSRATVTYFKNKALALPMGIQLCCARIMMAMAIWSAPQIAYSSAPPSVSRPLLFCIVLIAIGTLALCLYSISSNKSSHKNDRCDDNEKFRLSLVWQLLKTKSFIFPALVCMLYYGSVYPFMRFAVLILQNRIGISATQASTILFILPLASGLILPPICKLADKKRCHLPLMRVGAILLLPCLLIFSLPSELLQISFLGAIAVMAAIAISTALVAASVWPFIGETLPELSLGSAYGIIYWLQGVALMTIPIIAGHVEMHTTNVFNFSSPMIVFIIPALMAAGASFAIARPPREHREISDT